LAADMDGGATLVPVANDCSSNGIADVRTDVVLGVSVAVADCRAEF